MKSLKEKKGFTLLMSVLIASLVLSIGLGIFSLILRQFMLTSSSKESFYAFYAADSGMECALYWDVNKAAFATSSTSGSGSNVVCNGQDIDANWTIASTPTQAITVFDLTFLPQPHCATVTVTKTPTSSTIEARGYNTCITGSSRRVERGFKASY
jgi:Tfp pilus assembly protein PilX